jgi:hypothetical protein
MRRVFRYSLGQSEPLSRHFAVETSVFAIT